MTSRARNEPRSVMDPLDSAAGKGEELEGWKKIAPYLGVSEPTARADARDRGLPVYKRSKNRYYAYTDEIDAWKRAREAKQRIAPPELADGDTEQAESRRDRPRGGAMWWTGGPIWWSSRP